MRSALGRSSLFIAAPVLTCVVACVVACNETATNVAAIGSERTPAVHTSTVRPTVAWPKASTVDERTLTSLGRSGNGSDGEVRALVARSPVPVLAPKDLTLVSTTLVVEGEYFALAGHIDGATVALQGTRAAHRHEGIEPAAGDRVLRATKGFVSVNEGIRTASWVENGAAYSVDVECADARDVRCQSDDFLLSVVTQLAYVGGSGR